MKKNVFWFIIFLLMFISCKTQEKQQKCLSKIFRESKKTELYKELEPMIIDTILLDYERRYRFHTNDSQVGYSADTAYSITLGGFIFNKDSTKLFGWFSSIDKDKSAKLDNYKPFLGEIWKDGKWWFYFEGTYYYQRKDNDNQPYTHEYFSKEVIKKVVKGGIFKCCSCEIDYEGYIEEWFDEEYELRSKRLGFLKQTAPYMK